MTPKQAVARLVLVVLGMGLGYLIGLKVFFTLAGILGAAVIFAWALDNA